MKRSHSARVFRSVCRSSVSLVIVALMAFAARAEEFDWRDVAGYNWNSSVKDQADWGTCWAHGPVATLEAKYKITRNDPLFELDLSEEQLIAETDPMDFGTTNGGSYSTMAQPYDYFRDHGIVTETELPYVGDEFNGTDPRDLGLWPLAAGWENRVVKSVSCATFSDTLDAWKTTLKMYGPRAFGINGGTHVVTLVGFRDDANLPGGGYWIYKNSWGPNQGDAGYNTVNYDDTGIVHYDLFALTGGAYYSGALATATWNGGAG
ncbi:MAG TPA: C1 family peptidase, partial [Thermoguttaceae bacterium]|nr:C1 family peptidase [Thermoguttaceae bacterium]